MRIGVGVGAVVALTSVYAVAAVCASLLALIAWRRRRLTPTAAWGMVIWMLGAAAWALVDALETLAFLPGWPLERGSAGVWVLLGIGVSVVGFQILSRAVANSDWRPNRPFAVVMAIYLGSIIPLCATNTWTHLLSTRAWTSSYGPWQVWTPGPAVMIHVAVGYGLACWSLAILLPALRHNSALHRRQAASLLIAGVIPTVSTMGSLVTRGNAIPDLTGVCYVISGLVSAVALFRHDLFRLLPVARGFVLDQMSDALMVIDPDGRVLDLNIAARNLVAQLAPHLPRELTGVPAARILADWRASPIPLADGEYDVELPSGRVVLEIRIKELPYVRGTGSGRMLVIRDLTELHAQREELSSVNAQLRAQLDTIEGLRADLAELAVRDELTGLYNRRHLIAMLTRAIDTNSSRNVDLCVVLLDVDHFKTVNDQHGHGVGDALLAAVAATLRTSAREIDTVARYGGEEFVIVMPNTDHETALRRANEWRRKIIQTSVPIPHGMVSRTVSMGISSMSVLSRSGIVVTPAALLHAADEALYQAKSAGRDCVVLAGV